jgi:DNA-binding NarL/FixJ family response regulator
MPEVKYIAIIDDHTMFRKGLSALISMFPGYKVLFDAASGKDFISKIKPPHVPDIVLLDIGMPDMDGYATADWIKVNCPGTKILALSTMDSENAIIKMIKHGANGYILKDADPAELKLAFQEVLTKGYFFNELVTRKVLGSINQLVDQRSAVNTFAKLTDREIEFIKLACSEKSYQEIAKEMFLSERTIDGYRESVFKKVNVGTRVGLVMYAIRNNILQP